MLAVTIVLKSLFFRKGYHPSRSSKGLAVRFDVDVYVVSIEICDPGKHIDEQSLPGKSIQHNTAQLRRNDGRPTTMLLLPHLERPKRERTDARTEGIKN